MWLLSKLIYSHTVFFSPCSHGLTPTRPSSLWCYCIQRDRELAHKRSCRKETFPVTFFLLKLSKGVYTHRHIICAKLCQKSVIQRYSINIIHLPCGHLLNLKTMKLTVKPSPFLSFNRIWGQMHAQTVKCNCSVKGQTNYLLKEEATVLDIQTLRFSYFHSPDIFYSHTLSCPLVWI